MSRIDRRSSTQGMALSVGHSCGSVFSLVAGVATFFMTGGRRDYVRRSWRTGFSRSAASVAGIHSHSKDPR